MSVDEDSFIVIEETPSMLQYSILDSMSSNRSIEHDTKLDGTNVSGDETNTALFASALSQSSPSSVDAVPKIAANIDDLSIQSDGLAMPTNQTNVSTHSQKSAEVSGHHAPMSKSTLAHSFLLGDINCDIMKVKPHTHKETWNTKFGAVSKLFFVSRRYFHSAELFASPR